MGRKKSGLCFFETSAIKIFGGDMNATEELGSNPKPVKSEETKYNKWGDYERNFAEQISAIKSVYGQDCKCDNCHHKMSGYQVMPIKRFNNYIGKLEELKSIMCLKKYENVIISHDGYDEFMQMHISVPINAICEQYKPYGRS